MTGGVTEEIRGTGAVAAAFLAAGLGSVFLGLCVVLVEANGVVKNALTLSPAVGPLSGKVVVPVVTWIATWTMLHIALREKEVRLGLFLAVSLLLVAAGFALTFPVVFDLFA